MQRLRIQPIAMSALLVAAIVDFIGYSAAAIVAAPQQQTTTTPQATPAATVGPTTPAAAPTLPVVQTAVLPAEQITDAQSPALDGEPGNSQGTTNGVVTNLNGQASNVQSSNGAAAPNQVPSPQSPFAPVVGLLAVLLIGGFVLICGLRAWRDTTR
jgi:cobalamin biosynthesis Mg chelatase CobN